MTYEICSDDSGFFFSPISIDDNETNIDLNHKFNTHPDQQLMLSDKQLQHDKLVASESQAIIEKRRQAILMIVAKIEDDSPYLITSDINDYQHIYDYNLFDYDHDLYEILADHEYQIFAIMNDPLIENINWEYHKTTHHQDNLIKDHDHLCSLLDSHHLTCLDNMKGELSIENNTKHAFHNNQIRLIKFDPTHVDIDYHYADTALTAADDVEYNPEFDNPDIDYGDDVDVDGNIENEALQYYHNEKANDPKSELYACLISKKTAAA